MSRRFSSSLFLFILIISSYATAAFQSDELLQDEDDEEFGLEGGGRSTDHATTPTRSSPSPSTTTTTTTSTSYRKRSASTGPDLPSSDSKSSVHFSLEHNLGGPEEFIPAGTFSARTKASTHGGGGPTLTKLRFSRNAFTASEKEAFKKLLKDDDFYTIRLPSNILNPPGKDYIISSVRARCISREEGLDEIFIIHMEGGNVLSVNYGSSGACQYPRLFKLPMKWVFNSYPVLKYSEQAKRTPTFVEDMLAAQNGEGEGVKPIEKSFWAKYWMYLIPLGFIVLNAVTQAMNMPEEQANGPLAGTASAQGQQSAAQRAPNAAARRR